MGIAEDRAKIIEQAKATLLRFQREDGFDEKYGTNTRPFDPTGAGKLHVPTLPRIFRAMVEGIDITPASFTFVDVGAGKGRTLMLGALYPFRRCIGVELGQAAFDVATQNLAIFKQAEPRCADVSVVLADATTYDYPNEDLFLWFFNPFNDHPEVMQRWITALGKSLEAHPRRVVVAYYHPEFAAMIEATGFLKPFGKQGAPYANHDIATIAASIESGNYSYAVYSNFT
jgi:hypothetical protein